MKCYNIINILDNSIIYGGVFMIKTITIKNFKSIQNLTINCVGKFNVLIGANNIGKTSIFEAIHLWKMCYDLNLKKDKSGFYSNSHNLPFRDMEFIRVYNDMDLFPAGCAKKDATMYITLVIEHQESEYSLGFSISKVTTIDDAYLQVEYIDANEFKNFENMVRNHDKKLDTFLTVNESRPVANIIVKEPYMYKAQVMDKIAKGKGYEVLRNKLRDNTTDVESHINNVLQTNYHISEVDRDNKQYISMHVDGKNILSFGSGFLQLAEIFSSIEYLGSEIGIFLIDEPDSHLHLKIQKRLIDEFRTFDNMQLFIITHNERFLECINEDEILFLDETAKYNGSVANLRAGSKGIVMENLSGCLQQFEKLQFARKLVLMEGIGDLNFLNNICTKYETWTNQSSTGLVFEKMDGIDTLNGKLISYARALKGLIPSTCEWLVIRDTDCVPINQKILAGNDDKKNVDTSGAPISVIFQDGYGIESTFLSDHNKFTKLVTAYYGLNSSEESNISSEINRLIINYSNDVKNVTHSVHKEWKKHFERQIKARSGRVYDQLKIEDVLIHITPATIQYIMTKELMKTFLLDVHNYISTNYSTITVPTLDCQNIFTFYYSWISGLNDLFDAHKDLLDQIYS